MIRRKVVLLASSVGLGAFCLAADYVVFKLNKTWKEIPHGKLIKASLDNIAHALVGGWSWLNLVLLMEEPWSAVRGVQVVCCTAMASLIDLDHFISAGSLSFTAALSLEHRPFAHNTSLIIAGTALLSLLLHLLPSLSSNPFSRDLPAMFFVACLSHHLRDADRRGVWFGPFCSTPPIPFRLYILLVAMIPVSLPRANMVGPALKWVWSNCMSSTHPTQQLSV